jgi:hypothetical protein
MLKGKVLGGIGLCAMLLVAAGCVVEDTDPGTSSQTIVREKDTTVPVPVPVPGPSTHTETNTVTDPTGTTKSTTTTTTG